MKKHRVSLTVFILLLASMVLVTACEETASRFTDRAIENLEEDVGGAADRSRQRAADQAGGAICGSNVALILLFAGTPALFALNRAGTKIEKRWNQRKPSPSDQDVNPESKSDKVESNGKHRT